jgi:hypothetical protein
MTRITVILGGLLLAVVAVLYAQEPERLGGRPLEVGVGYIYGGAGVPLILEGTTADGFELMFRADPTADTNYIWPATPGSAGTQLQTDGIAGATVLSWASAGSSRKNKILEGTMNRDEALRTVLGTPIYKFHYRRDAPMSTQDFQTQYVGPVAEEAPWAMHHNGTTLNEINTAGFAIAAIQAQQAQIEALKAEIAALRR